MRNACVFTLSAMLGFMIPGWFTLMGAILALIGVFSLG